MGKHAEAESNFPYHPRRPGVCHLAHVQLILLTVKEATSATLRSLGLNLGLYLSTAVFFKLCYQGHVTYLFCVLFL